MQYHLREAEELNISMKKTEAEEDMMQRAEFDPWEAGANGRMNNKRLTMAEARILRDADRQMEEYRMKKEAKEKE